MVPRGQRGGGPRPLLRAKLLSSCTLARLDTRGLYQGKGRILMAVLRCRCGDCVRQRIIRAFLIEEQKIVKRVLNDQQKKK